MNDLQRTPEWFQARLGLFTPSRFGDMMQQGRGDKPFGTRCINYMRERVDEKMTGAMKPGYTSAAMQWGIDNEQNAIDAYQRLTHNEVEQVGFVVGEDGIYGGSPDGLVNKDGVIEVKCPYVTANHIDAIIEGEVLNNDHQWQIQGYLWITNRSWCHYVSYDPRMRHSKLNVHIIHIDRNVDMIDQLAERVKLCYGWVENRIQEINGKLESI